MSRRFVSGASVLVLIALVALSFNLRPAAVSVGPLLDKITVGLQMSSTEAGVLTALPVLAFAIFGALAPRAARQFGVHRVTLAALVAATLGLIARPWVDDVGFFLLLSLLALAGMAAANVLLPSLVKRHFPTRIGLVTAIYSTALAIGLTAASVATVPLADHLGGWRGGLMAWAVTAGLAALPWIAMFAHDKPSAAAPSSRVTYGQVARTRLGRWMALYFGLQSLQAYSMFGWLATLYSDAGFSSNTAGLLLGLYTGISIPLSLVIPVLAAQLHHVGILATALTASTLLGYSGILVAPTAAPWLWVLLAGIGACTFPLILALIGLRSRTAPGTAALSAFAQSVGYLIAATGPFLVGVFHDATNGWTVPMLFLMVLLVPQWCAAMAVARPRYIEDELHESPTE